MIPRRVLMTADGIGGVWTYALDLAAGLRRRGIEVVLATMGAPLRDDQRASALELGVRVHESEYRLEWMPEAWDDVDRAGDWLLRLADEAQVDAIHLNGYCHATLPFHRPVIVVAHSCVWSWWWAVHRCAPPPEYEEYRARVRAGLLAADRVVAPTRAMLQAIQSLYAPLPEARVIWNGRDRFAVRPGPKQSFVLAAGRVWDEAKNLQVLERVAPRVDWPIRVAGDPRHPHGGRGDLGHVQMLGRLAPEALAEQMKRASIFVAPARYEPFGLGPVEAALAGCALVLGDIPSLREVWGEDAWFAPPDDADAIVHAIECLSRHPTRRARLSRAVRRRALALDAELMADAYAELYRGALAERERTQEATTVTEAR